MAKQPQGNKFERLRDRLARELHQDLQAAERTFEVGSRPFDSDEVDKETIWDMYMTADPMKRQELWDTWDVRTQRQFVQDFSPRLDPSTIDIAPDPAFGDLPVEEAAREEPDLG
jgi:hypothetical protein